MRKLNPIRVTSVLGFVESAWKEWWWRKVGFEAADKITKESSEFGTSVHKLVENALLKNEEGVGSPEELMCATRILDYIADNNIKPLLGTWEKSLEIEVKDESLGLIGHFDMAALVNGEPCIVDFKTSKNMRKSFPLQKAAYAKLANKQLGLKIDRGITIRAHWNQELLDVDFEVKEYNNLIKRFWPKFQACLTVWMYFNRAEK